MTNEKVYIVIAYGSAYTDNIVGVYASKPDAEAKRDALNASNEVSYLRYIVQDWTVELPAPKQETQKTVAGSEKPLIYDIEMHLSPIGWFPADIRKQVKAAGGKYSRVKPVNSNKRFVHLPVSAIDLADKIFAKQESDLFPDRQLTVIFRFNVHVGNVPPYIEVRYLRPGKQTIKTSLENTMKDFNAWQASKAAKERAAHASLKEVFQSEGK